MVKRQPPTDKLLSVSPDEIVRKILKKECSNNKFGTTVAYLSAQTGGLSPSIVKQILGQAPWAKVAMGRYYYVEPVSSILPKPIDAQASVSQPRAQTVDFQCIGDLAFTKPIKLTYFDETIAVNASWTDVYIKLFSALYDDYSDIIPQGQSFSGSGRPDFGNSEIAVSMVAPKPIRNVGLFLETNLSATYISKKIKILLDICNVDYENVLIEYKHTTQETKKASTSPILRKTIQGKSTKADISGKAPTEEMFYRFLKNQANLAERTCRTYVSAIWTSEQFAKKHNYSTTKLFHCSSVEAITTAQALLCDSEFIEINRVQHNALSEAIHQLFECIGFGTPTPVKHANMQPRQKEVVSSIDKSVETKRHKRQMTNNFIAQIETSILQADLDGVNVETLATQVGSSVSRTREAVNESVKVVDIDGRLIHEDAFIDWEEAQKKLDELLTKLMERNDGYVSVTQLYDYAHAEMQMFLNDHDIDKPEYVYALARHLFEKNSYLGKKYAFIGGTHISRQGGEVGSLFDLAKKYSVAHGGFFRPADLADYFVETGSSNGTNLYIHMRINQEPAFFYYDEEHVIAADSMDINEAWLTQLGVALKTLFDDVGDHIALRSIESSWYRLLPGLPSGRSWTPVLLQNLLFFYGKDFGCHTIGAANARSISVLQSMLVTDESEIQDFCDAVVAVLVDNNIDQRDFSREQLRLCLVELGLIGPNQLMREVALSQSLSGDSRFAWDADGKHVTITI